MASRTRSLQSRDLDPRGFERAAREALSSHAGHTFTDAEWARARNNLLEFVKILRAWETPARTEGRYMDEALLQKSEQ